uniref:Minor tail protein n=1 Tax=Myoviridae sp. ctBtV12 TaxID=2825049 RepID=A0A8S5U399_9CAUD|nr:MAG TPA: minor tail protein [Myoviridae sp. ctBtV12]
MAVKREIRTTLALDGENEYKKALSEAQRGLRVLGSELKLASAEFETNGDKQAFLTAKSQTLRSEIAQQEEIVKSLEGAVKDAGEKYGETAKATDDYQIKLNSAKATLEKMRRELDATDREAQDLGRDSVRVGRQLEDGIGDGADQAKESLESMAAQMKQSLEEIKSSSFVTAVGSAWNMAQGVYQGLSELEESSREYNRTLAIFKQNVEDDGFDYEWAKGKADEVASITGSIESALSGVRALTQTGWNSDEITEAINNIVGACLKYDGTTFDGLAQSIQETISKGEATGQFAKVIESMGYDVNEFNEAMKNAETPTGKLQVALAYLTSSGLIETKKSFEQNNKQLIEAQSASNRLKEAWAGLGEKAGIVSTPIKNNLAAALEEVNALLGEITEKGFWKTFMEHGNDRPIQWDESSWLSPENWLTFEDVSNYLQELFDTGDQTTIDYSDSYVQSLKAQFKEVHEQLVEACGTSDDALITQLSAKEIELQRQIDEAMDGINQSAKEKGDSAVEDAKITGQNLSTGIGNGITEKESVALAAAQTTVNNVAAVLGQLNSMVFSPTVAIGSPFTRGLYDLPTPSGGSTKGADKVGAQSLAVSVNVDGKAMAKAVFPHIDTLQGTAAARNNA